MEQVYAVGVTCIEFIQYWFADYEHYFEVVNNLSNPHHVIEYLFPIISIVDSVFAAQLLLCIAFGGWLNAVMKWWLLEERPYWWVRETSYYDDDDRPRLRQFAQTCETGPGCPSGHTATMAMLLMLTVMWISHVLNDRKYNIHWWKCLVYPLFAVILGSVMLARLFVAAHFPHQCLLGGLVGAFLAPALCIYVSDPYVWRYGIHAEYPVAKAVAWHTFCVLITILIGILTYYSLKLCGVDPQWTVKLAFKWCESPEDLHVSTTPLFALVQTTGHLLGWALTTPRVAQYRHDTRTRSIILSTLLTWLSHHLCVDVRDRVCRANTLGYFAAEFLISSARPLIFLTLVPNLATWPYSNPFKPKTD